MSFIETRDSLLNGIKSSESATLRTIADAEADTKARFEKLRKEVVEEYAALNGIVHEAYGKPEDKPEVVETIVT